MLFTEGRLRKLSKGVGEAEEPKVVLLSSTIGYTSFVDLTPRCCYNLEGNQRFNSPYELKF
jgi:hypothetical protein